MPFRRHHISCLAILLAIALTTCRQAYSPPAISEPNRFLVVDGFINAGPNTVTTFNLNRTRNLGDSTVIGIPELNAQVSIVGTNGASYLLTDMNRTGTYSSAPLTIDISSQYSIAIITADGLKFSSDPTPCKATPPIDSLYWREPGDLSIYVGSHDPTGDTRYYRYDYNETWIHDAQLQTPWAVQNGMIIAVDSTNQKTRCWSTDTSTRILLATSTALSGDIIDGFAVNTIPNGDAKADIEYSILVRQYALTEGAYNYWALIQKTTQDVGTLFDVQPTQLVGNIHCTTNPTLPVIGYISAYTVQQQRIFIAESALTNWQHNQPGFGCDTTSIPVSFADPFVYNYPDTNFAPYYFITGGPLVLASRICLDCTLLGGNNYPPPFWPH
jgi:hypothetical protein